jgi:hypothetical protein
MSDPLFDLMAHGKPKEPGPEGPLNVLDENANKCCRRVFSKHWPKFDEAACPVCGTEYRAEIVEGIRLWRIVEHFAVVRRA